MLGLVLRALVAARLTDLRAQTAQLAGVIRSARHERSGKTADRGAIDIQCDAPRHHLHILFFETRSHAMVAGGGASVTRVDAALVFVMWHSRVCLWMR